MSQRRITKPRTAALVDVTTGIEIDLARHQVAAYAADPDNAPAWYVNIRQVDWQTRRPAAVGSQISFVASFLGRRLAYTYEIQALDPGERLVMRTSEGPFPMETTYTWSDTPSGGTRMTLRNRGAARGLPRLAAPLIAAAVRHANRKDLRRLRSLLERDAHSGSSGTDRP